MPEQPLLSLSKCRGPEGQPEVSDWGLLSKVFPKHAHLCSLLDPQEYVGAFQSSLWLSNSPGLTFKLLLLFVPTKITALGSLSISSRLLFFFFFFVMPLRRFIYCPKSNHIATTPWEWMFSW